jgi:hypothetical protein
MRRVAPVNSNARPGRTAFSATPSIPPAQSQDKIEPSQRLLFESNDPLYEVQSIDQQNTSSPFEVNTSPVNNRNAWFANKPASDTSNLNNNQNVNSARNVKPESRPTSATRLQNNVLFNSSASPASTFSPTATFSSVFPNESANLSDDSALSALTAQLDALLTQDVFASLPIPSTDSSSQYRVPLPVSQPPASFDAVAAASQFLSDVERSTIEVGSISLDQVRLEDRRLAEAKLAALQGTILKL